jgi:hypothetical protein
MKGKHIAKRGAERRERQLFVGRKGIIVSGHLAPIPLRSRAQAIKSAKTQPQFSRPIRGECSQAGYKRQTAAKMATFVTGIRRFMKAYAILRQKLYARSSEHTLDPGNPVLVFRVATHFDIRDRVSMETGRPSQVPNRPIARCGPSWLVHLPQVRNCAHVTCDKVTTAITISPDQAGIQ